MKLEECEAELDGRYVALEVGQAEAQRAELVSADESGFVNPDWRQTDKAARVDREGHRVFGSAVIVRTAMSSISDNR